MVVVEYRPRFTEFSFVFPLKNVFLIFLSSQCNNMYIFPGIGLASSVSGVSTITDRMLYLASVACSGTMTQQELDEGRLFPNFNRIRTVSANVATSIIEEGLAKGLCTTIKNQLNRDDIHEIVTDNMYYPNYVPLIPRRYN